MLPKAYSKFVLALLYREQHGYHIPTWVMGMGVLWVRVWFWFLDPHIHPHTLRDGYQ